MPQSFAPNIVAVSIDGLPTLNVHAVSIENCVGSRPGMAEIELPALKLSGLTNAGTHGKNASITIDGRTVLTGTVRRFTQRYSDSSIRLIVLDARWDINSKFIGQDLLGSNGLPVLGADIVFNARGKPNQSAKDTDTVHPKFCYEITDDGTSEVCDDTDAKLWTYKEILKWIFDKYCPDNPPSFGTGGGSSGVPDAGGLEKESDELALFGVPVADAIQTVLSKTRSNWTIDEDGNVVIFNLEDPFAVLPFSFTDPDQDPPKSPFDYDLTEPCEMQVVNSTEDAATEVIIVGGRTVIEFQAVSNGDFYDAVTSPEITPVVAFAPTAVVGAGSVIQEWCNYQGAFGIPRWKFGFRHDRYVANGAGKNIRRKDRAKPMLSELLARRGFDGNIVNPDNECGVYGIATTEQLAYEYPYGFTMDFDRAEVHLVYPDGSKKPTKWVLPVVTELRKTSTASLPITSIPNEVSRMALRPQIQHKERPASIEVAFPVCITRTTTSGGATWTIAEALALPSGATRNYALSGSGSLPVSFTINLPAGVVQDGQTPLDELADIVVDAMGEPVNVNGEFPSYTPVPVGSLIEVDGAIPWAVTGDEIVVAWRFDGESQGLSWAATNHLGADATELAQAFIYQKRFRGVL